MAKTVEITDSNFEEIINSDKPVLVDFWAEWCGPCKMIGPIVEEIGNEMANDLKVGKLNVDHNRSTPMKYGVMSIPTLLYFKEGQLVNKTIGAYPKPALEEQLDKLTN